MTNNEKIVEAKRLFNKIISEHPDFNEAKVIDYVAAVMGTSTDNVSSWIVGE